MESKEKKRAIVAGGNGFLGLNLISELSSSGWHTTVFDMSLSHLEKLNPDRTTLILGDITDPESCERAMPEGVDAVFHLAGNTSHWKLGDDRQTKVNINGTRNMVKAALKRKAKRFVYTSSIAAYGFQPGLITEETTSNADNYWINYFRTKRQAEIEVHRGIESGLDAVMLNPSNIVGPYDHYGWSRMFRLVNEDKLPGAPPGKASFCHVKEVAKAHISAHERGTTGHNYLLGGSDATWLEFMNEIAVLLGKKTHKKPIPAFVLKTIGQLSLYVSYITKKEPDVTPEKAKLVCSDLICSTEKAVKELDYKVVHLNDMLKDCHQWMISERML